MGVMATEGRRATVLPLPCLVLSGELTTKNRRRCFRRVVCSHPTILLPSARSSPYSAASFTMHERNEQRRPSFLPRGWGRSGKHFPLSRSLGEVSASVRLRFRAEGKVPQKPPHAQLSHPSCNTTEFTHERVRVRGVPPHFHKRRARRNHAISQRASERARRESERAAPLPRMCRISWPPGK